MAAGRLEERLAGTAPAPGTSLARIGNGDVTMDLMQALGGQAGLAQMARELGVNEQMIAKGAEALMPALLGGFKKQAVESGGLEGLAGLLGSMGGGNLLDAVLAPEPTPVAQGEAVAAKVLGGAEVQQAVAGHAAEKAGIPMDLIQKMLPMVAMAAAGFMSKQASAATPGEGGLGGLIGQVTSMLSGGQQGGAQGLASLAGMLDLNGDGNPLDDIMGMMGGLKR